MQTAPVVTPRDFLSEYAKCFKWTNDRQKSPMAGLESGHGGDIYYDLVPGMHHKRRPPTTCQAASLDQRSSSPLRERSNQTQDPDKSDTLDEGNVTRPLNNKEDHQKVKRKIQHRSTSSPGSRGKKTTSQKEVKERISPRQNSSYLKENLKLDLDSSRKRHSRDQEWTLKKRQLKEMLDILEMEHSLWKKKNHVDLEERRPTANSDELERDFIDSESSARKRWTETDCAPRPCRMEEEEESDGADLIFETKSGKQQSLKQSVPRKRWVDSREESLSSRPKTTGSLVKTKPVDSVKDSCTPRVSEYQHSFTRPVATTVSSPTAAVNAKSLVKRSQDSLDNQSLMPRLGNKDKAEKGEVHRRHSSNNNRQSKSAGVGPWPSKHRMEDKSEYHRMVQHEHSKTGHKKHRQSNHRYEEPQHQIMVPRVERGQPRPDSDVIPSSTNEKPGEHRHHQTEYKAVYRRRSFSEASDTSNVPRSTAVEKSSKDILNTRTKSQHNQHQHPTGQRKAAQSRPSKPSTCPPKAAPPPPPQPSEEVVAEILSRRRLARSYQRRSMDTHIWWWVDAGGSPYTEDDDVSGRQVYSLPIGFERGAGGGGHRALALTNHQSRPRSASPCGTYSRSGSSAYTPTPREHSPGVGSQHPPADQPDPYSLENGSSRPGTYRLPDKDPSSSSHTHSQSPGREEDDEEPVTMTTTALDSLATSGTGNFGNGDHSSSRSYPAAPGDHPHED